MLVRQGALKEIHCWLQKEQTPTCKTENIGCPLVPLGQGAKCSGERRCQGWWHEWHRTRWWQRCLQHLERRGKNLTARIIRSSCCWNTDSSWGHQSCVCGIQFSPFSRRAVAGKDAGSWAEWEKLPAPRISCATRQQSPQGHRAGLTQP